MDPRTIDRTVARTRRWMWAWGAIAALAATSGAFAQGGAAVPDDALWARLEAAVAAHPAQTYDPAAVVSRIGSTPEALFAFVRDEIGLVPYRGALKGPVGTLLDGAGNALDRALLLRALLAEAGHDAALAHLALTTDQAAAVIAATRVRDATTAVESTPAALAERAAAELDLDAGLVEGALAAAQAASEARQAALAARAATLHAALAALVPLAPSDPVALVDDHWWVVLERAGDAPLDLDPTFADAVPGDRLAAPDRRVASTAIGELAALDGGCRDLTCGDRLHSVRVQAIAETREDDVLVEHVLLDVELLPADLIGVPLALAFEAGGGPEPLDPFATTEPAAELRDALLERDAWRPFVIVGDEVRQGRVVAADGGVRDDLAAASGGGPLGGFGGLGGGLAGGGADEDAFTAFWWSFEVRTPGVGAVQARRAVFDRVGPAARAAGEVGSPEVGDEVRLARSLALAGQTELAAWPAAPDAGFLSVLAAGRLVAQRDAWSALYVEGAALPMADLNERLNALAALRTPAERFALERGRADGRVNGGVQDALLVLAHHRRLRPDLTVEQAFDLIASPAAVGPGGAVEAGPPARLVAGVRDAILEAALASEAGTAANLEERPSGTAVADAFARDPRAWVAVRDAATLEGATALPPDLLALAAGDLAAGRIVVVPTDVADAVGFWSVDPASGATVAIGDRGWGQAMAGYAERANVVLQLRTVVNQYASMGRCLGLAVVQPLQGVTGVGDDLAACVFELVCGQLHTALAGLVDAEVNWTNVILVNTVDALWGGAPEAGFGGFCGAVWSNLQR